MRPNPLTTILRMNTTKHEDFCMLLMTCIGECYDSTFWGGYHPGVCLQVEAWHLPVGTHILFGDFYLAAFRDITYSHNVAGGFYVVHCGVTHDKVSRKYFDDH